MPRKRTVSKFYRNVATNMIHTVSAIVPPKREGHTNCGKEITFGNFKQLTSAQVSKAKPADFCRRCKQLAGQ